MARRPFPLSTTDVSSTATASSTTTTATTPPQPAWLRECLISLAIAVLVAGLSLGAGLIWQAQGLGWLAAGPLVAAIGWSLAWGFVLIRHLHQSLIGALGFWLVQGALWHGSYRDGPLGGLETPLLVLWALMLAGLALTLLALWLGKARKSRNRASL
ncbi:MAG: hypothetical protein WCD50_15690 [Onishia taeanensis]|uniref:hypothetical protein n=1 Tax=Onishia taeanensis TaxID=284577 RepID=UPI003C79AACB